MSSHKFIVKKFCNINNYLEAHNDKVFQLYKQLCLNHVLTLAQGSKGLTLLCPDDKYIAQLYKLEAEERYDELVSALRSIVIIDAMPTAESFKDKASDICSHLKKRVPFLGAGANKVELTKNTYITPNDHFKALDGKPLYVWNIHGEVLDLSSQPDTAFTYNNKHADGKHATRGNRTAAAVDDKAHRSTKKGGAEFANASRKSLFEDIFKLQLECKSNSDCMRDPAMEVLVSLLLYFDPNSKLKTEKYESRDEAKDIHELICSQLSNDTLTSLAIILKPYSSNQLYITDEQFNSWAQVFGNESYKDTTLYSYIKNPCSYYMKCMQSCRFDESSKAIRKAASEAFGEANKVQIVHMIKKIYNMIGNMSDSQLPKLRLSAFKDDITGGAMMALSEAELRIRAWHMMSDKKCVADNIYKVYFDSKPSICSDSVVKKMSSSVYYSMIHLILRSNALFYMPCYAHDSDIGDSEDEIFRNISKFADINKFIKLDSHVCDQYYNSEVDKVRKLIMAFSDLD